MEKVHSLSLDRGGVGWVLGGSRKPDLVPGLSHRVKVLGGMTQGCRRTDLVGSSLKVKDLFVQGIRGMMGSLLGVRTLETGQSEVKALNASYCKALEEGCHRGKGMEVAQRKAVKGQTRIRGMKEASVMGQTKMIELGQTGIKVTEVGQTEQLTIR